MTERLTVARFGHFGDGMADTAAGPVYVPYALPGECVEVEAVAGHPDRRRLLRVIEASPQRIAPFCPHFGTCGGCAVQHWAEAPYRDWKRGLVQSALAHERIEAALGELIDAHGEGRRRAVFHARRGNRDILAVGFSAQKAHIIVPIDRCPVLSPLMQGALDAAWALGEVLERTRKPLDIQVTGSDTGLDIDIRGSGPLDAAHLAALAQVAEARKLARITRHGELVIQRTVPTLRMGRATIALPPGSFLQATAKGEAVLGALVVEHAGRARKIVDLFCGMGPFALRLAEQATVLAADSEATALDALGRAAKATPGLKPVTALRRDLFRRPLVAAELKGYDAVVFDPPRQGAQAQARELAASAVPLVIAVSCNASSFARDSRLLIAGGYRLTAVTPVDQFRYTPHVEIVARFQR
ncbi:MAG: class I SAM-dependent RNA methyltransferase [Pseudorhodoplanes sp.]